MNTMVKTKNELFELFKQQKINQNVCLVKRSIIVLVKGGHELKDGCLNLAVSFWSSVLLDITHKVLGFDNYKIHDPDQDNIYWSLGTL